MEAFLQSAALLITIGVGMKWAGWSELMEAITGGVRSAK